MKPESLARVPYFPYLGIAALALWLSAVAWWLVGVSAPWVHAQSSVGGPLPGVNSAQLNAFTTGKANYQFNWSNPGGFPPGFGPMFTQVSCATCHSSPVTGGSSTLTVTLFGTTNPDGSFNDLANEGGPFLQRSSAPFIKPPVAPAGSCTLPDEVIPADATIVGTRHTPPVFGLGLIDSIADLTILANAVDQGDGIHGTANMGTDYNGNSRVGRFGFKAQQATLLQFTTFALNHDIGVTNFLFPLDDLPQGNPIPSGCDLATNHPNDLAGSSAGVEFAMFYFALYSAPAAPAPFDSSAQNGQTIFSSVGCAKCHTPSMQTASRVFVPSPGHLTGTSSAAVLSNQTANLYSDLLVHDMGPGLADGIPQGQATGSQWRTTPLWGLSLRTAYLHDGRASDLTTAIRAHSGEASIVIQNFNNLSDSDRQDLLHFLSSL